MNKSLKTLLNVASNNYNLAGTGIILKVVNLIDITRCQQQSKYLTAGEKR